MITEAISPLRQRMIEDMSSRKLGTHTQRSHIYSCKRFAAFLKRSPDTATAEDIRLFQLHLAETGMSICNRNRIMTGVRFLFRVTLRRLDLAAEIYHLREPGGLRASEVVRLKVKHIDKAQRIIRIEQSKGRKDRNVMLSPKMLDLLRQWWKVRPTRWDTGVPLEERWLFPGRMTVTAWHWPPAGVAVLSAFAAPSRSRAGRISRQRLVVTAVLAKHIPAMKPATEMTTST